MDMGYIGIDRGIRNHWIYQDSEYFHVWFEMIACARYSEGSHRELVEGELVEVNYGEFIFGRIKWSQRLGVSEQRLRTLLKKLIKDEMIEVSTKYRKSTVYRIKNYEKFNHHSNQQESQSHQGIEATANQQTNQQVTSSQPAANHKQESKEINKEITTAATAPDDDQAFQKIENAYIQIHGRMISGIGSPVVLNLIEKQIHPEFIINVMKRIHTERTAKGAQINCFSYYEKPILEAWEKELIMSETAVTAQTTPAQTGTVAMGSVALSGRQRANSKVTKFRNRQSEQFEFLKQYVEANE